MFSPFFHVAAFATLFAAVLAQGDLTINTPYVALGIPAATPTNTNPPAPMSSNANPAVSRGLPAPPLTRSLTAGSAPSGSTTGTIASDTSDTEVTYTPGEGTANTQIVFNIRDSTGKIAQTGIITVGGDSASTCQTSASGGGSSGSATGSSSGSTQTTGSSGSATTSKSSASHSGSATGSASASGASSSGSSAPDAASANFQGAGIAGVVGAALVAFLA